MNLFETLTEAEIEAATLDPRELETLGIEVGPVYRSWSEEIDLPTPENMGYNEDEVEIDDVEELRF